MFFRHTVGMEWVRHFQHPCFDVEVYGLAARVRRAQALLLGTDMSLSQVAHAVGYATQSRFCTVFRDLAGVTPGEYRRKQAA